MSPDSIALRHGHGSSRRYIISPPSIQLPGKPCPCRDAFHLFCQPILLVPLLSLLSSSPSFHYFAFAILTISSVWLEVLITGAWVLPANR